MVQHVSTNVVSNHFDFRVLSVHNNDQCNRLSLISTLDNFQNMLKELRIKYFLGRTSQLLYLL